MRERKFVVKVNNLATASASIHPAGAQAFEGQVAARESIGQREFIMNSLCLSHVQALKTVAFALVLMSLGSCSKVTGEIKSVTNSVGMKLVWIEKGSFDMGSPSGEWGRDISLPQRLVTLTKGFYMGATEVTQKQWLALMSENPSKFKGDDLPVEDVTWEQAVEFCEKLSAKEGKRYRLPTEAEWEYACRSGTTTAYHEGDTEADLAKVAWYGHGHAGSEARSYPVGQKKPNAWGLYDMHGNVFEWCSDWEDRVGKEPATDPTGPAEGWKRIRRGGSWQSNAAGCHVADRDSLAPKASSFGTGFRVVQDASE